jgi:hypothetical protein
VRIPVGLVPIRDVATSGRAFLLLSLLLTLPACVASGTNSATPVNTPPTLLTSLPPELDFGQISPGGRSELPFTLRNPGSVPVPVTEIRTSCDCFRVALKQDTIEPGDEVNATAVVDFSSEPGFRGKLLLQAKGLFEPGQPPAFVVQAAVEVK